MKKSGSKRFEFVVGLLKKKPTATFEEVRAAGKKHRLEIIPVVYGRARAAAGLKAKKPRLARQVRRQPAAKAPTNGHASDQIEHLVSKLRRYDQLKAVLEQIRELASV